MSREPDAAAASSTDRGLLPERSACVGAALIAAGFAGLFIVGSRDFPLDDAWIHLAYAKSLRLGDGLSYNPGDWETGASSPLWVLALASWPLSEHPVVAVKLLGLLLHAATAWLAVGLTLDLGRQRASLKRPVPLSSLGWLAGTLVATHPVLLQGATSGMEVPLAAALLLGTTRAAVMGAARPAAALGFFALLARPEALVHLVALAAVLAWARRTDRGGWRAPVFAAGGALVALGAWVLYDLAVSGHPWPNTQYVKGVGGGLDGLGYVLEEVLPWHPWLVSLSGAGLLALALVREIRERRWEIAAIVVAAAATMVAIAITRPLHPGVGFYESRYFAIVAPAFPIAATFGLVGLHRAWGVLGVAPLAVVTGLQVAEIHPITRAAEEDTRLLHTTAARHLAEALPADAVVGVEGAGATRFFAPRSMTIVDLVGLNDREAAHLHFDVEGKMCHVVHRGLTHLLVPTDWLPVFGHAFELTPEAAFVDDHYTQVHPPRRLEVVLLTVDGIRPAWATRCASRRR